MPYTTTLILWIAFGLISCIGFFVAYLYGRKTKSFRWREYVAMLTLPLLFVLYLSVFIDKKIFLLFLASALVGFATEGFIGFVYHQILNKRLWTYTRLSLRGYTSLLSLPLWGIGGIVFWMVSKLVGL